MCGWTIKAYYKTQQLFELLKKQLKNSFLIGIDETVVQVLKEPGKSPESKSYMWVFRGGTPKNPIILFQMLSYS